MSSVKDYFSETLRQRIDKINGEIAKWIQWVESGAKDSSSPYPYESISRRTSMMGSDVGNIWNTFQTYKDRMPVEEAKYVQEALWDAFADIDRLYYYLETGKTRGRKPRPVGSARRRKTQRRRITKKTRKNK